MCQRCVRPRSGRLNGKGAISLLRGKTERKSVTADGIPFPCASSHSSLAKWVEQLPGQYASGDLIGICPGRSRKEGSRCSFLVLMMVQTVGRCPRGRFLKTDAMAATRSSAVSAPTIVKWKMGRGGNLTWDLDSWVKLGVRGNDLVFLESFSGFPRAPPSTSGRHHPKDDARVN